jgi:hypothetical protein
MNVPNRRPRRGLRFLMAALAIALIGGPAPSPAAVVAQDHPNANPQAVDWDVVAQALGKPGQLMPGDVYRVGMPRTDLNVMVDGVPVKAGFALGSYAAFKQMGDQTMVMGDLVLLDEEVNPVMSGLFEGGLSITGLHNHLSQMSPHVMYLHYSGMDDPVQLATVLRRALSASGTPLDGAPPAAPPTSSELDTAHINSILGRSGRLQGGGVFQFSVPRAEPITEMGIPLLPAMGVATVINFQPTEGGKAAITGDFVMVASEVSAVASTLRANGIQVTALHNHALGDEPRLFYMHFWANDDPVALARGLRAAVDQTNSAPAS